ncbi:hypothetical protein B425_0786 [Bacillus amyloliquefaciens]|nr:hypothetical protein B425_0786 [Bacillus amyloliquefaciens]
MESVWRYDLFSPQKRDRAIPGLFTLCVIVCLKLSCALAGAN